MNDNQDMFHPEEESLDELNTLRPEEPVKEPAFHEDHTEPQSQEPGIYRGRGAGRKESPFADSPYVMEPGIQFAQKPKKQKKARKPFWKTAVCAVLILALVGGACGVTGYMVNSSWEKRAQQMENEFQDKLNALEQKIGSINTGVSVSGSPLASADGLTPAQVYAKNVNSVVMIHNKITTMGQTGTSTGMVIWIMADNFFYHKL